MIEQLLQADRLLTVDMVDQAELIYTKVSVLDPNDAIAVVGLARCALARGDDRAAHALASKALGIDPENDMALRMERRLAEILALRGEAVARPRAAASIQAEALRPVVAGPAATVATKAPPADRSHRGFLDRIPGPLMRVLVTGGAGYVGSVSVERLATMGHHVVVLDTLVTGHAESVPPGVELVTGSVGDTALVESVLREQRIDAVLHCAARSIVAQSMADPALYYRENVVGGIGLLDGLRAAGVDRIVFSSTAAVYGSPDRVPIRESAATRPVNPYGASKLAFEGAMGWYAAYGMRSVSLRYFNVAGASERFGERHDPETHLIPNILRAAVGGAPVTLFGDDYPTADGTAIRDYIHVVDLADAHIAALELTERSEPGIEVCNLGSGSGYSVRQVLDAARGVVGRSIPSVMGPRREGDPPVLVASTDRARKVLGWQPLRGSLGEMIDSAWRLLPEGRLHPS